MNTINKLINIVTDAIPVEYFGKTYSYFSFEVFNDEPIHLFLVLPKEDGTEEKIVITGLNETPVPYNDFIALLKSITIDNSNPRHPLSMDLKMAREKFKVDIKVTAK